MIPALKASTSRVRRLGAVYVPNGMSMPYWRPPTAGPLELSPILKPLEPVKDRVLVLSGMDNREAEPLLNEGDGDHSRAQAAFLTGAHAMKASGVRTTLEAGVSMDQIAARQFGRATQIASLELSLEANDLVGQCEDGYGCAYSATLAWKDANTPLPMETDPRAVFERLFGATGSTEREARLRGFRRDQSLLDSVSDELASLRRVIGNSDRSKLNGYLDSVRDIERRIQIAESQGNRDLPVVAEPAGVPVNMELFARFVQKMQSTPDGDGTLLDNSLIIYGAGMSNSNAHTPRDLPIALAGGAGGQIKGGRHLRMPAGLPLANLHLTVLDKMGVPVEHLGNSTGELKILSEV
jgi:hypothetical protein